MPILITDEEFPEPPPLPEEPPSPTPAPEREGSRSWSLADATGTEISLANSLRAGYVLRAGMTGHGMPAFSLASDPLPADHGSVFRALRATERDLFVPIALVSSTVAGVEALRRGLQRLVDPLRGQVTLTVAHPSGERRWITGRYVGGAEGDAGLDSAGRYFEIYGLTIRCLEPWWYSNPTAREWRLISVGRPFLSDSEDFFPVVLASSSVAGTETVLVDGDVPAEPIWEITGPGDSVIVENTTTGESWTYAAAISGGQTIRVDCRRTQQTVVDVADDSNEFANLAANPALWLLQPGDNVVEVTMPSATSDSLIRLRFSPRYRSAG